MANCKPQFIEQQSPAARLAVLVSGRGSNLQAILDAIDAGHLPAQVTGVFSDQPGAPALQRVDAKRRWSAKPSDFPNRFAYETALTAAVAACAPDWVICAGYMRLLKMPFIEHFSPQILNIHPSLLPRYKGLNTHARALAANDRYHGASIHVITPELDAGQVLAQAIVPIHANDTVETLGARVLGVEHPLLVATLRALVERRLVVTPDGAQFDGQWLARPLILDSQSRHLAPAAEYTHSQGGWRSGRR